MDLGIADGRKDCHLGMNKVGRSAAPLRFPARSLPRLLKGVWVSAPAEKYAYAPPI
jgi:hypothetical protein